MDFFTALRPATRHLPPEAAHKAALLALQACPALAGARRAAPAPALETRAFGLTFPSPIGLAAGFDKDAEAVKGLFACGFGFVEVGTITPRPQPGNPRPRLFRLEGERAVINRMGFNGKGLEAALPRLARASTLGVLGVNIGKNRDGDAVEDYVRMLRAVSAHAAYITANISSPNTMGLRDLQRRDALGGLIEALLRARAELPEPHRRPLLVKIAPDLSPEEREDIARLALDYGLDGLIIGNTTVSRPIDPSAPHAGEEGGLSGRPLMALSTQVLSDMYRLTQGRIPLVGVGGVASPEDAYAKIRAGASLVQLYTALVYQGFGLVADIIQGLPALLARDGFTHLPQAVGADVIPPTRP